MMMRFFTQMLLSLFGGGGGVGLIESDSREEHQPTCDKQYYNKTTGEATCAFVLPPAEKSPSLLSPPSNVPISTRFLPAVLNPICIASHSCDHIHNTHMHVCVHALVLLVCNTRIITFVSCERLLDKRRR